MNEERIKDSLQDWLSIIDYTDKEQAAWCRRNITELKIKLRKSKKEKQLS